MEEPIEASKLFRVERIKPIKGNPFWEQKILRDLGVGEKVYTIKYTVLFKFASKKIVF